MSPDETAGARAGAMANSNTGKNHMQRNASPGPRTAHARFVSGPIMGHILVMTGTSAIGLMAIFASDLANLFFLGRLQDTEILAAIGYASTILYLTISIGIGLSIATVSRVAPRVGAGELTRAKQISTNALITSFLLAIIIGTSIWLSTPWLLEQLGAAGRTARLAKRYVHFVVPFMPFLAVGMCSTAILRSLGDARRAMHVTLSSAVITLLLDPLLILYLDLAMDGAAIVACISRIVVMAVGLWGVAKIHRFVSMPQRDAFFADLPAFATIAVPAMLTNIATPFANAVVTAALSPFGDMAIAGWTLVSRLVPVAFGVVFALSGAIGPIIGQNLGAGDFQRVRDTMIEALKFLAFYTSCAWAILAVSADSIASVFNASAAAADLVVFFCRWIAPFFAFLGALFTANAAFNTLGRPHFSTAFNWGRATLGTIPFVYAGAAVAGAKGVIAANFAGTIAFGVAAVLASFWLINKLAAQAGK